MTVLTSCHCEFISNPRQQKATRRSNHSGFTQQERGKYDIHQPKNL